MRKIKSVEAQSGPNGPTDTLTEGVGSGSTDVNNRLKESIPQSNSENSDNKNPSETENSNQPENTNVNYSDPDTRFKYIKSLLLGKCETNSTAEQMLFKLFKKYPSIVKCPGEILNYTNALSHEILYDGPKKIFIPPYRCTELEEELINAEVREMLTQDLIEASKSGFNLPILIVKKRQGGIRICTDSRSIGKHICKIRLPLPAINDLIRKMGTGKYFCVLDLKTAYYQILLDEESRGYTCFRTSLGAFQFKRLSFGLPNAPSSMQTLISKVVCGLQGVVAYLDDILISGDTLESCKENLEKRNQT